MVTCHCFLLAAKPAHKLARAEEGERGRDGIGDGGRKLERNEREGEGREERKGWKETKRQEGKRGTGREIDG